MKPSPPMPPPCREYRSSGFGGDMLVNEYKTVDWYTQRRELFNENNLVTKIPKFWLFRLFMSKDQIRLEQSLRVNREMCRRWPRV